MLWYWLARMLYMQWKSLSESLYFSSELTVVDLSLYCCHYRLSFLTLLFLHTYMAYVCMCPAMCHIQCQSFTLPTLYKIEWLRAIDFFISFSQPTKKISLSLSLDLSFSTIVLLNSKFIRAAALFVLALCVLCVYEQHIDRDEETTVYMHILTNDFSK